MSRLVPPAQPRRHQQGRFNRAGIGNRLARRAACLFTHLFFSFSPPKFQRKIKLTADRSALRQGGQTLGGLGPAPAGAVLVQKNHERAFK